MGSCYSDEDALVEQKQEPKIIYYCPNCSNRSNVSHNYELPNSNKNIFYSDILIGKSLKEAESFILMNKVYDNERTENLIKYIVVRKQDGEYVETTKRNKYNQRSILLVNIKKGKISKCRKNHFGNGKINK
jgi:hypothetical protein